MASPKLPGQRWLPGPLRRTAALASRLYRTLPRLARTALREGFPDLVLSYGVAPGDDLLSTAVMREVMRRGRRRIWMMSGHPTLFEGNRDLTRVVPADTWYADYARMLRREFHELRYSHYDPATDTSSRPARHVIAELCAQIGLTGEVALRPYLSLTGAERAAAGFAEGCIAIQSSGLAARVLMKNKEWFPERFQMVVDAVRAGHRFVQLGSASDPRLAGVQDLRGRTSLREAAAVLSRARLFVGLEGFLMHVARAVECPAVIVFGGRTAAWQLGYSANVNLGANVACSPCWRRNTCPHDRLCMDVIGPAAVVEAIDQQLERDRGPLALDTAVL